MQCVTRPSHPLRPRSTTAIVATRSDGRSAAVAPAAGWRDQSAARGRRRPAAAFGAAGALRTVPRRRRIGTVVTWIVLGLLIAALWAMLLLGDSLAPMAQ
jgi:hypothetical protein